MYYCNTYYAGITVSSPRAPIFFSLGEMGEASDDSSINKPYIPERLHVHHAMLASAKQEIQLLRLLPTCCIIISGNGQILRTELYITYAWNTT